MKRNWIILGATSIIAEHFAHHVAQENENVRLVARDFEQLNLISQDIKLRYSISCDLLVCDLSQKTEMLFNVFDSLEGECDLFIAHSDFYDNSQLTPNTITQLINTNILSTAVLINHYLNLPQEKHNLIFLSSVAASRGRAKNSLYGGTKAAIELYLQGLQQAASKSQSITIAKLGFIDTKQTYGLPGVFYAAPPKDCALACLRAVKKNKRLIYFPKFWFFIMTVICSLPFFFYKRMKV